MELERLIDAAGSAYIDITSCFPAIFLIKNLCCLFELSGRPRELSEHPRAGKCNLEKRVELERLREFAGPTYIGIKSCIPVIFLMKYLYGLFELSGRPGELSDHPWAGKYNLERRVDIERLRDAAGPAYIGIESCVPEK